MRLSDKAILILGPPAGGKSTQGEILRDRFYCYLIDTSSILRQGLTRGDGIARQLQYWKDHGCRQGERAPEEATRALLSTAISDAPIDKPLIFVGMPRYAGQGTWLLGELQRVQRSQIVAVRLTVSSETILQRAMGRSERPDSSSEVIGRRLREHRDHEEAIIQELTARTPAIPITEIDGEQPQTDIALSIVRFSNQQRTRVHAS